MYVSLMIPNQDGELCLQISFLLMFILIATTFNRSLGNLNIRCHENDLMLLLNFKQGVIDPNGRIPMKMI